MQASGAPSAASLVTSGRWLCLLPHSLNVASLTPLPRLPFLSGEECGVWTQRRTYVAQTGRSAASRVVRRREGPAGVPGPVGTGPGHPRPHIPNCTSRSERSCRCISIPTTPAARLLPRISLRASSRCIPDAHLFPYIPVCAFVQMHFQSLYPSPLVSLRASLQVPPRPLVSAPESPSAHPHRLVAFRASRALRLLEEAVLLPPVGRGRGCSGEAPAQTLRGAWCP